jgi:hypothetical protein
MKEGRKKGKIWRRRKNEEKWQEGEVTKKVSIMNNCTVPPWVLKEDCGKERDVMRYYYRKWLEMIRTKCEKIIKCLLSYEWWWYGWRMERKKTHVNMWTLQMVDGSDKM